MEGNVVANLRGLGVASSTVGVVGTDSAGEEVRRRLEELECDADPLLELSDWPTTEKTRVIARNQQIVRIDREESGAYDRHVFESLADAISEAISSADVCVLSDYGKGVCTPGFIRELINQAGRASVPVLVDPKGRDFAKYRGADCITPNLEETDTVVRLEGDDDAAVVSAAREISRRFDISNVLVTRSAEGMSLLTDSGSHHFDARAQEVYDVSGAGDTVVAALAAGLAAGLSYIESAALANVAAGIVVGKLGTAPVETEEMARRVASEDRHPRPATVATVDEWVESESMGRRSDQRLVLLDGFVDEVNSQTVEALEGAAGQGDVLVVFAWPEGPVDLARDAAGGVEHRVLAGIAAVDAVLVLDDQRYAEQLGRLRPDVVVRTDCLDVRPPALADGFVGSADLVDLTSGSGG